MDEPDEIQLDATETLHEDVECYCQLGGIMNLLSRRFAMQVICVVAALGPVRYGTIKDAFGNVSSSTLSTRLEELGEADILDRTQYDEIPPRVEYQLTSTGEELASRLMPLLEWIDNRQFDD